MTGLTGIEIDWMQNDYSVEADGVRIAAHFATFCPLDADRIACYARNAADLEIELPKDWQGDQLAARALFEDHREPVPVTIENRHIMLSVKAGRPVIVYRNAVMADKTR